MAKNVYLKLKIDGTDIEGESTVLSLDREGTIECLSFHHGIIANYVSSSGQPSGNRQHEPVRIHKRIDKSTPLILEALFQQNKPVEAIFMFFRPTKGPVSRRGSSSEEHFFTVLIENGHISGVKQVSEDTIIGGGKAPQMMEEVAFTYHNIKWTNEISGEEYQDSWMV